MTTINVAAILNSPVTKQDIDIVNTNKMTYTN